MNDLAIAYVTCDKYDHVWEEWYDAFMKHWDLWSIPKYFCGEEKVCPFDDFTQIEHEPVEAEHWTAKLRAQIEQIPEDYIFVWVDDQIQQKNISAEFESLYKWMVKNDADALRFMSRGSASRYIKEPVIDGVYKLTDGSSYRVSFSPNIYKKSFLLEVLLVDQSPWACELGSVGKFTDRNIYARHIDGWVINKIVQ